MLLSVSQNQDEGSWKKAKKIKDKDPGKYFVMTIQKAKELQVYKRRNKGEAVRAWAGMPGWQNQLETRWPPSLL
ncbi:hypothetical protein L6164_006299 [Bauhinia variegata]|uniref:Uncharacterized protein n=1 Tax=Bauhinia variegata TaxID=167791 RepID=A0ACB9PVU6_BAUVA|nr:hypothetical protein L6164_006299 [Bauhinia variegata]